MTAVDLDRNEWEEPVEQTLEERVAVLEALVVELRAALAAKVAAEAPPELHFRTLPAFVEHFCSWYRREVWTGYERVWCPDYWRHEEASIRLELMWRGLEKARQDPVEVSSWLRDNADVHMAVLLSPGGPFAKCSAEQHADIPLGPLPVSSPPDGWWTEADSGL